jgi:hypothetical protein
MLKNTCFLTALLFTFTLSGQGQIKTIQTRDTIAFVEPICGDKYAVVSSSGNTGELTVYDKDHKTVVSFKDGDSRLTGKLFNPGYKFIIPRIYCSFSGRYISFNTWDLEDKRSEILAYPDQIPYVKSLYRYDIQEAKLEKIVEIGQKVQVTSQYRNSTDTGYIYSISSIVPNGDTEYIYLRIGKDPGKSLIVIDGIFSIDKSGKITQITDSLLAVQAEDIKQDFTPFLYGRRVYFAGNTANHLTNVVDPNLDGIKYTNLDDKDHKLVMVLGAHTILNNGTYLAGSAFSIPDYGKGEFYTHSLGNNGTLIQLTPQVGTSSITNQVGRRLMTKPSINKGNIFYADRNDLVCDWSPKCFNTNDKIVYVSADNPSTMLSILTSEDVNTIGPNIADRVASMGCSVLFIRKETGKDTVMEKKIAVLSSVKALDGVLELKGCFAGANRVNGIRVYANNVPYIPTDESLVISEDTIRFKVPATMGGITVFEVEIFGNSLPPLRTNKVVANVPVPIIEFSLENYFLRVKPNEEFFVKWISNILGKVSIKIGSSVIATSSTDNYSGTSSYKVTKDTKLNVEFVAINGSRFATEMNIVVINPEINFITRGRDDENRELPIGREDIVYLSGSALSYDGEEHFDETGLNADTKVFVNNRPAKVTFISESMLIFEIPNDTEIGEGWIEVRVNNKSTVYKVNIEEKNM